VTPLKICDVRIYKTFLTEYYNTWCYTEHHLLAARYRKEDHYGPLLNDLKQAGFSVNLVTIEVGCLGHFEPETVSKLSDVCHLPKNTTHGTLQQAACVAISCSYRIFNSHASLTWDIVDLFTYEETLYVC